MRKMFLAGAATTVVYRLADHALILLNEPSNLSVTAGYLLLVGLVAVATELISRPWRPL